ncbi:zinc-binding protein [Mesorhizobium sp. Root552]|nr:DNA gyrase inhibitor YacG [Mesorhizobium sp. Root552]KQZ19241.1 zinc-binding protein [Mesorhizobium sp. Root552]
MAGKRVVVSVGDNSVTPLRPKRPCPECGRPSARDTYPFCSKRCKDIDLNRWLKGVYVIPGRDNEEETEDPPASTPQDQE